MKHLKYIFLFSLFYFNAHLEAQTLHIEAEQITLTQNSQLFIEGTLQTDNNSSIVSENETATTTLKIGNQLISQILPFATSEGEVIPILLQTEEVSENSSITASTYPTAANNTPLPSTVADLTFSDEDISAETLNRFWILTLNELNTNITFTFTDVDIADNEANEEKLQLIFHNGTQWIHIDSGSSDGVGSLSYTAQISQSGVYALFAGDVSLCAAGDVDQDGICDDVDDCIGEAIVFSLTQTICEGEEFEGFTESGTFTDTFTAVNGCDSTRTLELTVLPNIFNELEVSICEGEDFEGFTESGTFTDTFVASNGCDSTRTLQLEVVAEIRNEMEVTICEGEDFEGFTESGTFEDTFVSAGGCDSTRVLQLTVLPEIRTNIGATICEGEDFEGFTESGTFTDTFVSASGCDSVRTLQLEVRPNAFNEVEATICEGEDFEGFTESGTFTDTFVAFNGCDSTRILQLEVLPNTFSEVEVRICEGEDFEGFSETGIFETIFTAANGCDSTRTVILEVVPTIELTESTVFDDGGGDSGAIEVVVNGNEADFSFDWSNGDTGSKIEGLQFGTYLLTITDSFGCTAEFEFEVGLNTDIDEHDFLLLQIYPNPTQSSVWLQFPSELQNRLNTSIQLLNVQGEVVKNWRVSNAPQQELPLIDLQSGIYMLQIQGGESGVYFAKVVKM